MEERMDIDTFTETLEGFKRNYKPYPLQAELLKGHLFKRGVYSHAKYRNRVLQPK